MSAYVVDRNHIRFLVTAADQLSRVSKFGWYSQSTGGWRHVLRTPEDMEELSEMDLDQFGQMLWDENFKSVNYRYRSRDNMESDSYVHPKVIGWGHIDPVAVLKACACYRYQSCEHEGWKGSDACDAIKALERVSIDRLPGYEDAKWGAPEPTSNMVSILNL